VWNARMLCKVNGTAPEDYGKAISCVRLEQPE
jgi:hypothetical protein